MVEQKIRFVDLVNIRPLGHDSRLPGRETKAYKLYRLQVSSNIGESVLAFGTQVRGFKPDRSRWIFQGEKNPQHAFLRRGRKAFCLMS